MMIFLSFRSPFRQKKYVVMNKHAIKDALKDPVVRSNNLRAIGIHFVLSMIGILLAVVLAALAFTMQSGMFNFYIVVGGGIFVYFYCGYRYLKPVSERRALSVFWLACITGSASALSVLGLALVDLEYASSSGSTIWLVTLIPVIFNTVGAGISVVVLDLAHLVSGTSFMFDSALSLVTLLVASVLPSSLLCLGLCLQERYPRKEQSAYQELLRDDLEGTDNQPWPDSATKSLAIKL